MVRFRKLVIPALVLVLFVGGAFAAYQVADQGQKSAAHGDGQTVTNESITQEVGVWQLVDKSTAEFTTGFNDTVTVHNSSGVELTAGTDYEWNATDGAIKFLDTASTSDGASANVTYTYFENTEDVKALSGPLRVITEGVGQIGYLGAGLSLVVFLLGFGVIVAKAVGDSGPRTNR